jgi:hypothetical protein
MRNRSLPNTLPIIDATGVSDLRGIVSPALAEREHRLTACEARVVLPGCGLLLYSRPCHWSEAIAA